MAGTIYKISFVLLIFMVHHLAGFAQKDTSKQFSVDPSLKIKNNIKLKNNKVKKDSLKVYVKKEKPNSFLESLLYEISPNKYVETFLKPASFNQNSKRDSNLNSITESEQAYQLSQWKGKNAKSEAEWAKAIEYKYTPSGDTSNILRTTVYGYHPYWCGNAYESYNFKLLSRIAYFCYDLDPKSGKYKSIFSWRNTKLIPLAHKYGTKVDLTVTNFGQDNNALFLTNPEAQKTLTDSLISLIRNADGVNIDFEEIPKQNKDNFTKFIVNLSKSLKKANKRFKLTLAIPAVDWTKTFDIKALADYVDYFFIMGYDYYGVHSKIAGPNSLIFSGSNWSKYNINNSVNYYLLEGVPKEKLILGVSYCYKEWETNTDEVGSEAKSFIDSRSYRYVTSKYAEKYISNFDTASFSTYYIFREDGKWKQLWGDDEKSLAKKYDYIQGKELGGVGIWALGYDNGYTSLWKLLAQKFSITKQQHDSLMMQIPMIEKNISSIVEDQMAKNVIEGVSGTNNVFVNQTKTSLDTYVRVISLVLIIMVFFLVIGFLVAIWDYDVRLSLFATETKVYSFFLLLIIMFVVYLRVSGNIEYVQVLFILGVAIGAFIGLILYNVGKIKKNKRAELTP